MYRSTLRYQFLSALVLALLALMVTACDRTHDLDTATAIHSENSQQERPPHESYRHADEYFFVDSFKDLQEELEIISNEQKQGLFVFFEMQGCSYCQFMKEKVLSQTEVQDFYNQHFRSISIDIHAVTNAADVDGTEMTEKELAARYGVNITPTMIFFGTDGSELHRRIGILKTSDDIIAMGAEILEFLPENK